MTSVKNVNPENELTLLNIVGCTVPGATLEKIAGRKQLAIKSPKLSQIACVGVTIVVLVPNETEVRSFLCYIIIVLSYT